MPRFLSIIVLLCVYQSLSAQYIVHRFYLIGDAGLTSSSTNGLKPALEKQYDSSIPSTVLFLGDNIYPKGMPPVQRAQRKEAEAIMQSQLSLISTFNSAVYFIPGNHDWQRGGRQGWEYIAQQQAWIDSLKNNNIKLLPSNGCPGPEEIVIDDATVLVILDSQWFLHPWEKPEGEESPCEAKRPEDVLIQLQDIFERNRGKRIIVAAHHPIFTYGEHGGVFTAKDHLFPLLPVNKKLYVPLPIIGSIYPLYRKVFGNIQDVAHPLSKQYRTWMMELMEQYPGTVYVNGHEHALQYSVKDSVHYITSGASVKTSTVKKKGYAQFVSSQLGFAMLSVYDNGKTSLQFFEVGKPASVHTVSLPEVEKTRVPSDTTRYSNQVMQAHASLRYEKGRGLLLGNNYRDEWKQIITTPVFNLGKEKGGLTILQKGGGMQTLSLRVADSVGNEYTLRSVEKFPEKAVPEMLRKTFVQDIVQDQISAAHPYGALVISPMAAAAGIYHTQPSLVYIPDDIRLGNYREEFANTLALFEERPDGDASDKPHFGNSKKIISTTKLLEKLREDNDHQVDQEFVVRSRLFDLLIGDWDRHDDQWRWASFKDKKTTTYRPIPRDRDQTFFVSDGLLAKFWSRRWAMPKFEGFNEEVRWTPGFMFNARYFDRSFLNGLEMNAWKEQALYLKQHVTDEVIEQAIRQWPTSIYELRGEEVIRKLKARRNKLDTYAAEYYSFLAKEVDILGSNKRELFDVVHKDNGDVTVRVTKINKKGEKTDQLYDRTFHKGETKELRLHGLGGDDVFSLSGEGRGRIKIRIVGGEGRDVVTNQSHGKPYVYDEKKGIDLSASPKSFRRLSNDPTVNAYDRKSFQYPRLAPLVFGNFNFDDGLFIGGGFLYTNHGFRKNPYKSQHLFLASRSLLTESFNFKYDGRFPQFVKNWTLEIDADVKGPNFVNNFFGWGNETVFDRKVDDDPSLDLDRSIDYYRIRTQEIIVQTRLAHTVGAYGFFNIGPVLQRIEIEEPKLENRFIEDFDQQQSTSIFEVPKTFAGLTTTIGVKQVDNPRVTTRGINASVQTKVMRGVESDAKNFTSTNGSIAFYQSFRLPARITFAIRAGGGINTGSYDLYNAQILDGKTELRGYRKTRFYGDSEFYNNNEVRLKIASFKSYLFPASLGINTFFDTGRVWYKNENGLDSSSSTGESTRWHKGYGGGVWFTPFNLSVVSAEFAHSRDGNMVYVRLGFLF